MVVIRFGLFCGLVDLSGCGFCSFDYALFGVGLL